MLTSDFNVIETSGGGYGILQSTISCVPEFNPSNIISAAGLGIQQSFIAPGTSLNKMIATGNGALLSVASFSASVRGSEKGYRYDPYTGRQISYVNDINRFLGTNRSTPVVSGVTNSGIINDTIATGSGNLGQMAAYAITGTVTSATGVTKTRFPMRVSFANSTNSIRTTNGINGLQVRTGTLGEMTAGGNVQNMQVRTTGKIKKMNFGKSVRGSVYISATGPEGVINTLTSRGAFNATVSSDQGIHTFHTGEFGGNVQTTKTINSFTVIGDVLGTGFVRAGQSIDALTVDGDILRGAVIKAAHFGTVTVTGHNFGVITTA